MQPLAFIIPRRIFLPIILTLLVGVNANASDEEIWDPLEPVNRPIFWFNDQLDFILIEPLATTYNFVVPDPAQDSVNNFFDNLRSPIYLFNDLLQGEFAMFGNHFARMVINTTVGVAGLFDVAEDLGFEAQDQDTGTTLALWGFPQGPYLVAPILGPMTIRSAIGRGVDRALYPPNYFMYTDSVKQRVENGVAYSLQGVELLQVRADLLLAISDAKSASVDYYSFVQNSFYQLERKKLLRGEVEDFPEDESYDFDDSLDQDLEPSL